MPAKYGVTASRLEGPKQIAYESRAVKKPGLVVKLRIIETPSREPNFWFVADGAKNALVRYFTVSQMICVGHRGNHSVFMVLDELSNHGFSQSLPIRFSKISLQILNRYRSCRFGDA